MRSVETILTIIRERGKQKSPLERVAPASQKLKLEYRLSGPYHKVPHLRLILGTQDESGEPTTSERRMVWFGERRLETQVMLCAGRPLHWLILWNGSKVEAE